MKSVTFRIDIAPGGKKTPGHRVVQTKDGRTMAMAFKAPATRELENTLRAMCAPFRPVDAEGNPVLLTGPLQVVIVAVCPRPAYLCQVSKRTGEPLQDPRRRLSTVKPDDDNVAKSLRDAMKDWWQDDKQIAVGVQLKMVAAFGEAPHYSVMVSELDPGPVASIGAGDVMVTLPF